MKCRECSACAKDWFPSKPGAYVCIGVPEPFIIDDINHECTEYKTSSGLKEKKIMIGLETKLNSCPKCGGRPICDSRCQWHDGQEEIRIKCLDCGLELDYSSRPNDLPHTSISWSYDEYAALSLDVVWNGAKFNNE